MWLCTQLGFFSIVRNEPDTFHICARCREDLNQLAQAAGTGTPIASYAGSELVVIDFEKARIPVKGQNPYLHDDNF